MTLYALGLKDQRELPSLLQKVMRGETLETEETSFSFDELLSLRFRLLLPAQCYEPDGQGGWVDKSQDEAFLAALLEDAPEIRIVGIVRPVEDALVTTGEYGMIGYTAALTEYAVEQTAQCAIVQQQLASPQTDVFTGLPFALDDEGDYTLEMLPGGQAGLPVHLFRGGAGRADADLCGAGRVRRDLRAESGAPGRGRFGQARVHQPVPAGF